MSLQYAALQNIYELHETIGSGYYYINYFSLFINLWNYFKEDLLKLNWEHIC